MTSYPPSLSRTGSSNSVITDRKGSWASSTQGRNPVSLRLYKVLGSNYEDDATREALRTLSELYVVPGPSKIRDYPSTEVQEMDDFEENPSVHTAIESVPGESAARARRNLRRDMENQLTEGSKQFLKAFGEVDQVCSFTYVFIYVLILLGRNWTNYNSTSTPCD